MDQAMVGNTSAGVEARTDDNAPPTKKPADLSKFQLRILAVLADAEDAPKGVAVKRRLHGYYDAEVNHGRLYPNLDELVSTGLVTKGTKDQRTNAYGLTDAGRDVLAAEVAWLTEHTGSITEDKSA